MFRPLETTRTVRGKPLDGEGLEHLVIEPFPDRIEARSVVIGERGGLPYGARCRLVCDPDWRVREFGIGTADGRGLALFSPSPGRWIDAAGEALSAFDGCIDIDLAGSPFTNTLSIRRLNLSPESGTAELEMLYIPFDTFAPQRDGQRYTCLKENRLYRYEAANRSFAATVRLDEDGLVTNYPPLFTRAR